MLVVTLELVLNKYTAYIVKLDKMVGMSSKVSKVSWQAFETKELHIEIVCHLYSREGYFARLPAASDSGSFHHIHTCIPFYKVLSTELQKNWLTLYM